MGQIRECPVWIAVGFINRFANEFNVDVFEFDCSEYFYAEWSKFITLPSGKAMLSK